MQTRYSYMITVGVTQLLLSTMGSLIWHELISKNRFQISVHMIKQPSTEKSTEKWHIAVGPHDSSKMHVTLLWVFIAPSWKVIKWSSLEACLQTFRQINVEADL